MSGDTYNWYCDQCGKHSGEHADMRECEQAFHMHKSQCRPSQRAPMLCRATGPDWKTGELLPDCQMPHGHKGECENKTGLFTDAELRAECERRKLISGDLAVVDLVRASDASIVAECERRHIGFQTLKQYADDPQLKLREEALFWKQSAENWATKLGRAEHALHEMTGLRDEWKRRAEAAEGNVARFCRDNGMPSGPDPYAWLEQRIMKAEKLESLKMKPPELLALFDKAASQMRERGPGIDPRPDNSVAWLDEDLLADDAD